MATFSIPGQNIQYSIPDDGQVWRDTYDDSSVYVRSGNNIQQLNFETLGKKKIADTLARYGINLTQQGNVVLPTPTGDEYKRVSALLEQIRRENPDISFNQSWGNNGFSIGFDGRSATNLGRSIFEQQSGVSYGSLEKYLSGDAVQAFKSMGGSWSGTEDFNAFKSQPKSSGEVFTLTPNASNPHAQVVTSSLQGKVYDPVATGQSPATPQAGALGFNAQTMVNPNQGGPSTYTQPATVGAATGVSALPNNGGTAQQGYTGALSSNQSTYDQNPLWLRPNETVDAYYKRVAQMSPSYQKPQTQTQTGTVSSAQMTAPSTNFSFPTPTDMWALTPKEKEAQALVASMQGLNQQYADLAKDPELTGAKNRLSALQTEAQQIPLQIQNNFEGRGVTRAGIQPIQTGALRNNTIAQLGAASSLEALMTSKYGPLEAQINATKANLEAIINSPEYTIAEKRRAQQQLDYQNQLKSAQDAQKTSEERKWEVFLTAVQNGADEATQMRIRNAATPEQALSAAGQFVGQTYTVASVQEYEYAKKNGYTGTFEQYQNDDANRKRSIAAAGVPSQISSVTGRPLTDAERTAAGYAQRMAEADAIIRSVGSQFTGVASYAGQYLPNFLQSAERQQFDQAKRNFINAVLRRESGAVISDAEFANAEKQYFPQPGDTPEVLAQKEANRATAIKNLQMSGGQQETTMTNSSNPLGI